MFVEMSASKVGDLDVLAARVRQDLADWKLKQGFKHPINFTIIPMVWKIEIGV